MSTTTDTVCVLHVDGDRDFAGLAAKSLERESDALAVDTATSVREGLEMLADGEFDCVVSDYDVSDRDGIDFLRTVRERHGDLPFILFTDAGSEAVASEAISAGVTDYLRKKTGLDQWAPLASRVENEVRDTTVVDGRDRLLATVRGASEREQREWELDFFGRLVETVGVGVAAYGEDGRYRYVNSEYARLLDADPERLEDTPVWEVNPELDPDFFDDYWASFDDGETRTAETHHVLDGVEVPVQTVTTRETIRGTPYHFGTIQDITERRAREREREVRSVAMEASIDGMAILDENDEYRFVNRAHAEVYGYDASETFLGESWHLCYPDDEVERLEREAFPTLLEDGAWRGKAVGERADGTTFPQEVSLTATGFGGTVCVVRDVTDRVERERELERQNERLDEFASIVSHDLRNPLNVATGRLQMARDDCDSDHLDDVASAHDRMASLIDGLLGLARTGGKPVEAVSLPEAAESGWRTVETADAALAVETDRRVRAVESRLRQLLENLFRNAVEHGGRDVTVTVGVLPDGFYVEDDGSGISVEDRERAFESGYSTSEDGTGLGLSIVDRIASTHDWDATLTEGPDGGTRVELTGVEFE